MVRLLFFILHGIYVIFRVQATLDIAQYFEYTHKQKRHS